MSGIILVGLGVSGLACAMSLRQKGVNFTAFEKKQVPGGLTCSERMDGYTFDYGPHIILDTPPLFGQLDLDLDDCACESRIFLDMAAIHSVPSPVQHHLHRLPLLQKLRVFCDIVQRGKFSAPPISNSFEGLILSQAGQTLFDLFFHGYEAKRLRHLLAEIDGAMPNRIQRPQMSQLFGFHAKGQPSACGGLDTRFKYPRAGGIDALPAAMAATLPHEQIHFGHTLSAIDGHNRQVLFANGRKEFFGHLVLSLPLPEIVTLLENPPQSVLEAARQLVYSSIYVLNFGLHEPVRQTWGIARIPRRDVDFYRVTVPSHYSKACAPEGSGCLMVEVGHHSQRYPLKEQAVVANIYAGLAQLGILTDRSLVKVEWLHNIQYGHIIYNLKTKAALEVLFAYLHRCGIYPCGKYGLWRDMLMPHAMQSGIDVAGQIVSEN